MPYATHEADTYAELPDPEPVLVGVTAELSEQERYGEGHDTPPYGSNLEGIISPDVEDSTSVADVGESTAAAGVEDSTAAVEPGTESSTEQYDELLDDEEPFEERCYKTRF